MKKAAAIVTDRGGRTCHAAIVAREHGIPAIVGAADATSVLKDGALVTVSCTEGETGRVYAGLLPIEISRTDSTVLARPRTPIMVNVGNSRNGIPDSDADRNRRRGPRPHGVHHQRAYRGTPDGAGSSPDRVIASAEGEGRDRPSGSATPQDARTISSSRAPFGRRRHHRRGVLSQAGDRAALRLQDERIRQFARRRGDFEPRKKRIRCWDSGGLRALQPIRPTRKALRWNARRCAGCARKWVSPICASWCRSVERVEEGKSRVIATMAANGLKRGDNGTREST